MDGLYAINEKGQTVERLAERVDVSKDGRRLEFLIRKDARWSDGVAVSAQDFVTALRRSLAPGTPSKLAEFLMPIRGATDYRLGKRADLPGVFAHNEKLVIELEAPAPYFKSALTVPPAMPLRQDVLDANRGRWPENAPSTGPYRIERRVPDQELVLAKNPHYRQTGAVGRSYPERVKFVITRDESTAVSLFESGRLDILTRVPGYDLERLRKKGALYRDDFAATYYLSFNLRKPPFQERRFRQAVAGSVLRAEVVTALQTGEEPAWSWVPPGFEGFEAYAQEKLKVFAPAIAWVLLSKQNVPKVVSSFDTSGRNQMILEKVQQDLQKSLHLKIELQNMDWKTYVRTLQTEPPALFRFGWLAPFMDPLPHLQVFVTGNPNNLPRFSNAEYDRLVTEIGRLEPGPERLKKIQRAQTILIEEEAVVVPLYHYNQLHLVSERVRDFSVNPMGVIRFDTLTLR